MLKSETKPSSLKPELRRIPSVPTAPPTTSSSQPAEAPPAEENPALRVPAMWLIIAIVVVLGMGIGVAWLIHGHLVQESENPSSAAGQLGRNLPVGPGEVATTEKLAKPWSFQKFMYQNILTGERVPAMVVRLPGDEFWAFSLREPYGTCELEFVTDLGKLRAEYNFQADHPVVADPCNKTIFDLLRYSNGPTGLVRGEIVQGSAIRPPIAIEIQTKGNQLLAGRIE